MPTPSITQTSSARARRRRGRQLDSEQLIERWWTPAGQLLARNVFRFLRGEIPLPNGVNFHYGLADLRGIGVPSPQPSRPVDGKVDYGPLGGPAFQVKDVRWDQLDLSHAWLPRLKARGLAITECKLDHANCRSWRLERASVSDASFDATDFLRASLMGWNQPEGNVWTSCIFDGANMKGLELTGGKLLGCTFEQTRLDGTRFTGVELRNCVFSGPLRRVVFDGRRTAVHPPAPPMVAVDFTDADLSSAQFLGCRFRHVQLPQGVEEVREYPAVAADAARKLAARDGPEVEMLRPELRQALEGALEPDSVGVFDRVAYQAVGGEPLAALAEELILGSTKQSRSRRIEVPSEANGGARNVVSELMAAEGWSPPGMTAPEMIDLVAKSPDGSATLFIVEPRPWDFDPEQRDQLARKVTGYCEYLLEGRLAKDYPGLAGRPVVMRLECATEPPPHIQAVIRLVVRHLALQNIGFVVHTDPALAANLR